MVGESHGYVHFQKASVQEEAVIEASVIEAPAVLEAPAAVFEASAAVLEARVGWDVDTSFINIPFTPPVPLLNVSRAFSRMVHRVRSFCRFFSHPGVGSPLFHCFCHCFCPRCVLSLYSLVPPCVCVTCPYCSPYKPLSISPIYLDISPIIANVVTLDIPYNCHVCHHPRTHHRILPQRSTTRHRPHPRLPVARGGRDPLPNASNTAID